jgi:SAM-dependent methyltransferase
VTARTDEHGGRFTLDGVRLGVEFRDVLDSLQVVVGEVPAVLALQRIALDAHTKRVDTTRKIPTVGVHVGCTRAAHTATEGTCSFEREFLSVTTDGHDDTRPDPGDTDSGVDTGDSLAQRIAVKEGYDGLADAYTAQRSCDDHDILLDQFLEDAPHGPVLDAGCGAGEPVLARLGEDRQTVGMDFSDEQIARADTVTPGRVVQGDMTALPFADDAFAALTAFYSVIHVPFEEQQAVYDEFARVLHPGGHLLVTVGAEDWAGRNDDWLDSGITMEWSHYGLEASRKLLSDAGFDVYDAVGAIDTVDDDGSVEGTRVLDPDHDDAGHPFCFARLDQ